MRLNLILFTFLLLALSNSDIKAQCIKAEAYVDKVKAADNWTPTERANSGTKVQGWSQLGAWHAYKCECEKGGRTAEEAENLKNELNKIRQTIVSHYSDAGEIPPVITKCKSGTQGSDSGGQSDNKTATQREIENRFKNYNTAMNLKGQGEAIARAFAEQVKQFGLMGYASNPQEQLDNFNNNMQQIAQLQSQNKADNLDQIGNTLGSALNDLNAGNGEGALFSTLSLIDQLYEQKEAQKEAERQKQRLIAQQKQKMSQFYWKAVELNKKEILNYLQNTAYSFSKADEDLNLAYIQYHLCFHNSMEKNYSYTSTQWTKNNCSKPIKTNQIENNLISKDIQYINAAKRKFEMFEEIEDDQFNDVFREGAMRFAGAAATENPKAEYYYLMGHYAGVDNPLVAYTSFEAAKNLSPNYFSGVKAGEYYLVNQALQSSFKEAIVNNNQEIIRKIIASQLHNAVKIDNQPAIIYAIKVDQPDVVQLFLNDYANGKSQNIINTKVHEVIMMAAVLDAPKTIQRFNDMGFSVDFTIDGNSPADVAGEALSIESFDKIIELSNDQASILQKNAENKTELIIVKEIIALANKNDTIQVTSIYNNLSSQRSKNKALIELLKTNSRSGFFALFNSNYEYVSSWAKENREVLLKACFTDLMNRDIHDAWKYFNPSLLKFENTTLGGWELDLFNKIWVEKSLPEVIKDKNIRDYRRSLDVVWNAQLMIALRIFPEFNKNTDLRVIQKAYNSLNLNEVDLIEFSVHDRRDLRMAQELQKYHEIKPEFSSQIGYCNQGLSCLINDLFNSGNMNSVYGYNDQIHENTLSEEGITEVALIDLMIFGYGMDENALGIVIKEGCFKNQNRVSDPFFKNLVDKLIDSGYSHSLTNDDVKNIKRRYENTYEKDSKYWDAVFSGNYNKRY